MALDLSKVNLTEEQLELLFNDHVYEGIDINEVKYSARNGIKIPDEMIIEYTETKSFQICPICDQLCGTTTFSMHYLDEVCESCFEEYADSEEENE